LKAFPIFAALFLIIPIIEIYLLIQVGTVIGVFSTILLVIATAVIGVFLLRQQGLSTLSRFQNNVDSGQLPARTLLEGVFLLIGGALLLTPGFFTDTIGFLCLLPPSRGLMVHFLIKRSIVQVSNAQNNYSSRPYAQDNAEGSVYEGEFIKKGDEKIEHK
jgi:UPF0716 protein FxsA